MNRRLFNCIIVAVHRACDIRNLAVARDLLLMSERVLGSDSDKNERRQQNDLWQLIAAHERLWELRREVGEPETQGTLPRSDRHG